MNKACLVSCIVLKLKGMTINFPPLKALQRDCIKIQFIRSIGICFPTRYSSQDQQAQNLPWKNKQCLCCDLGVFAETVAGLTG